MNIFFLNIKIYQKTLTAVITSYYRQIVYETKATLKRLSLNFLAFWWNFLSNIFYYKMSKHPVETVSSKKLFKTKLIINKTQCQVGAV